MNHYVFALAQVLSNYTEIAELTRQVDMHSVTIGFTLHNAPPLGMYVTVLVTEKTETTGTVPGQYDNIVYINQLRLKNGRNEIVIPIDASQYDGNLRAFIGGENNVGVQYINLATPFGDANGDGIADSADVQFIRRYLSGLSTYSPLNRRAADLNNDNHVDILDLTMLRLYLAGLYV